jgi:hypothetical protein
VTYFDDLVTATTLADIRATVVQAATTIGWSIESLPRRARLRALGLQVVPEAIYAYVEVQRVAIRGAFRDLAEGGWLRALARQTFGVEPFEESYVTVPVLITNFDALPYSFAAGEVRVQNAVTQQTYTNVSPFYLEPAGVVGDADSVDFIADNPGSDANADTGDISVMATPFGTVTCLNLSNGRADDDELDEPLRERMGLSLASRSPNGAADAYAYLARSAVRLPDGTYALPLPGEVIVDATSVGITKTQVLEDEPEIGDVTLYLADADGVPAGADVTGINGLVLTIVRPTGVNFLGTFAATPVTVNITYTAKVRASDGFTVSEVQAFVAEALAVLFASARDNPIGGVNGYFYRAALLACIQRAQPAAAGPNDPRPIVDVSALTPGADVAVAAGEVPVLGTVLGTILVLTI